MIPALRSDDFPAPDAPKITNGLQLAFGAHLAQLFQRLRDLAAAAIEQRGVGIVVAERGEAGERHRTQLAVDREGFRVEADATERAGFAQSNPSAGRQHSGPLRGRDPSGLRQGPRSTP